MDFSIIENVGYPSPIYRQSRAWKGISFDEVSNYDNDNIVGLITILQDIGETL